MGEAVVLPSSPGARALPVLVGVLKFALQRQNPGYPLVPPPVPKALVFQFIYLRVLLGVVRPGRLCPPAAETYVMVNFEESVDLIGRPTLASLKQ